MSVIEIMDIKLHRQAPRTLRGFGIDGPLAGTQIRQEAITISGWAVGGETAAVAVEVVAGQEHTWRTEIGRWRPDIAQDYPAIRQAERAGFVVQLDLTPLPPVFDLAITVVMAGGNRALVANMRGRRIVEQPSFPPPLPLSPTDAAPSIASPGAQEEEPPPKASVVIPVHNQQGLTRACLEALFGTAARAPFEVVVVDDGSSDATPEILAHYDDRVRVIRLDPNAGFAAACNAGAALTGAEYVVLLNNDTIPQPGWLDALIAHADAYPEAAIVGSKLLYPDGTVQHAGVSFIIEGYPHHIYAGFPADHPAVNRTRRFQAVTAACCLIRASVFRALGGFDRAYVNGWEDVDFCLRAGEAGHQVHYCPASVVLHLESASRDGASPQELENRRRWAARWIGRVRSDCLDFWAADGLLAVDLLGPRYPVRFRLARELSVRGLPSLFSATDGTGQPHPSNRTHFARTAHRPFRPHPGAKRSIRRVPAPIPATA
jgi:GT2 family glycosyltransferase